MVKAFKSVKLIQTGHALYKKQGKTSVYMIELGMPKTDGLQVIKKIRVRERVSKKKIQGLI